MERTKYYKSKWLDFWTYRRLFIRIIIVVITLTLLESGLVYLQFFSSFSNMWGGYALAFVTFVLILFLIMAPSGILRPFESGQSLVGEPESIARSGPPPSPQVDLTRTALPLIRAVGEKITAASIGPGRWHLTLNFTVFNDSNTPILVYDMHARVYYRIESSPFKDLTLTTHERETVSLSQDNTITHGGKVFKISPSDSQSFALSLEISHYHGDTPADNWTETVFGVFVDIHESNDTLCYPVNCVFCFFFTPAGYGSTKENRVEVYHINQGNIVEYWERQYRHPVGRRAMKIIDTSLAKHLESVRRHV